MLMFAPLRSVMAVQQTHCDMDAGVLVSNSDLVSSNSPVLHDMSTMLSIESMHHKNQYAVTEHSANHQVADQLAVEQQTESNHQCCCCDTNCVSDCEMGMSVSLLMQVSSYTPLFTNAADSAIISFEILVRELTPPSRPPAIFS